MSVREIVPFEFSGEYGGFVFTNEGKRRMRLLVSADEYLIKVPKEMRRRIDANFRPGAMLHITGTHERDEFSGISKWVLSELLPPGAEPVVRQPVAAGSIRVCVKKNCWRGGGRELCEFLERESAARSLDGALKVKAVGCLDHCKHAPNIEWRGQTYTHCTLANAEAILDRIEAGLRSHVAANG